MSRPDRSLSIKDIAAISGVSIATVSRVLNHKGGYSEETEKRVLAVIQSYGYISNMAAKTLREAHSQTIGLILPTVDNSFFSSLAYSIESYLYEHQYSLFICNSGNQVEKEQSYFRTLAGKGVDGILCVSSMDTLSDDILSWGIPIVCIDRRPTASRPLPWVGNDDSLAGRLAAGHLLKKGCRHILFISSYLAGYTRSRRLEGYAQALEQHGLRLDKNYVLERSGKDPTQIETELLTYDFLQKGFAVDGIITTSEMSALGALYALHRTGLRVPEDVKLVSFDNTLYSLLTSPPLSSIERSPQQLARKSCEILLGLIQGRLPASYEVTVPTSLVERGSSK